MSLTRFGAAGRTGTVAGGHYFAREVLPRLAVEWSLAERTNNAVMELSADAF